MNDFDYMTQALAQARLAYRQGEVPVGAVLVDETGMVIGKGYNQSIHNHDPTAHAEILALRLAGKHKQNYRLNKSTLYVTLEPCPMCTGAIIQARVKRLVFACRDFKMGACGGVINLANGPASNHAIILDEGILSDSASQLLTQFFKVKRP